MIQVAATPPSLPRPARRRLADDCILPPASAGCGVKNAVLGVDPIMTKTPSQAIVWVDSSPATLWTTTPVSFRDDGSSTYSWTVNGVKTVTPLVSFNSRRLLRARNSSRRCTRVTLRGVPRGQQQGRVHGGVAAAHHHHAPVLIGGTVANGARVHLPAPEMVVVFFGRQWQSTRRGARGDYDGSRRDNKVAMVEFQGKHTIVLRSNSRNKQPGLGKERSRPRGLPSRDRQPFRTL